MPVVPVLFSLFLHLTLCNAFLFPILSATLQLLGAVIILMLATVSYQLVLAFCLQLYFNGVLTN